MFLGLAQERLRDKKQEEFKFRKFEEKAIRALTHKKSYSKYLYETLRGVYNKLKLSDLFDKIFEQMTIARIIEPASKLDTIEILDELGLEAPSNSGIHRSLRKSIKEDYR